MSTQRISSNVAINRIGLLFFALLLGCSITYFFTNPRISVISMAFKSIDQNQKNISDDNINQNQTAPSTRTLQSNKDEKPFDKETLKSYGLNSLGMTLALIFYFASRVPMMVGFYFSVIFSKIVPKASILTKGLKDAFLILVLGGIGLYLAYLAYLFFISHQLPIEQTFHLFVFVFFSCLFLYISPIQPVTLPDIYGAQDYSDRPFLIKLTDYQIAYVSPANPEDEWKKYDYKSVIDVSYKEFYVFSGQMFNQKLDNLIISEDNVGKLTGTLQIDAEIRAFPKFLSVMVLGDLNNSFKSRKAVERFMHLSVNTEGIAQSFQQERHKIFQSYFKLDPTITAAELDRHYDDILNSFSYKEITLSIQNEINKGLKEIFKERIIKATVKITDEQFHKNEMLEEIRKYRQSSVEEEKRNAHQHRLLDDERIHQYKLILLNAQATKSVKGLLLKNDPEFNRLVEAFVNGNVTPKEVSKAKTIIIDLKSGEKDGVVTDITKTIIKCKNKKKDIITAKEMISSATTYFKDYQRSIDDFFSIFFRKWDYEKESRTEDAYKKLVFDSLNELEQDSNE